MLTVADHCSHFTPQMVTTVVAESGYEVIESTTSWIPREICVVARVSERDVERRRPAAHLQIQSQKVLDSWKRLPEIAEKVRRLAELPDFGLFGTAIAATWLDAEVNAATSFFVDEDVNRVGRVHLGRPFLAPSHVPYVATLFVAIPQPYARNVARRLQKGDRNLRILMP
jgi:hypothetical protein